MVIAALIGAGLCKGIYDANIFASLFDVVPPEDRGTAAGLMNTVGWTGGFLAPWTVGKASKSFGLDGAIAFDGHRLLPCRATGLVRLSPGCGSSPVPFFRHFLVPRGSSFMNASTVVSSRARPRYVWAQRGDINAFSGLMLDNIGGMILMASLLVLGFGLPRQFVLTRMIPGTGVGVLVGDLIYTVMAFRLARRTGRTDVTAMPLGLDTPSTFGAVLFIIGPAYQAALKTGP